MRRLLIAVAFIVLPLSDVRAGPDRCHAVNCRADEIDAGLLTGEWRKVCRASQQAIVQRCFAEGGTITGFCDTVCPVKAWPNAKEPDAPPPFERDIAEATAILAAVPSDAPWWKRVEAERQALEVLQRYSGYREGLGFIHRLWSINTGLREARDRMNDIVVELQGWGRNDYLATVAADDRQVMLEGATSRIIAGIERADRETGLAASVYRTIVRAVDDLASAGADLMQFLQRTGGEINLRYLARVGQALRALDSVEKIKDHDEASARKFSEDWLRMLPEGMAKGYSGPASALAQENIIWTRKMFEASTDALNLVRDAIRDGRLDLERLRPIEERMKVLQKGPWTSDTVGRVIKAYVNDVPVLGPMFDLLADD